MGDEIKTIAAWVPISRELLMDEGLIPDTRPPRPAPSRRTRLRWWWRDHMTVYAIRSRLAQIIDPDLERDIDY